MLLLLLLLLFLILLLFQLLFVVAAPAVTVWYSTVDILALMLNLLTLSIVYPQSFGHLLRLLADLSVPVPEERTSRSRGLCAGCYLRRLKLNATILLTAFSADISCNFENSNWDLGFCNWIYDIASDDVLTWTLASGQDLNQKNKWKNGWILMHQFRFLVSRGRRWLKIN